MAPEAERGGFAKKVSVMAASSVVAGAALVSGPASAQLATGVLGQAAPDVQLAAVPSFDDSLKALLDVLGVGTQTIPGLIGNDLTLGSVLGAFPGGLGTDSTLSALLADLNPTGMSLNTVTGGFLGQTLDGMLSNMYIGTTSVDNLSLDSLMQTMLGISPESLSIYNLLNEFGMGSYAGLISGLGLCLESVLGICTDPVTASSSVSDLLQGFLGVNPSSTTLGSYLDDTDITIGGSQVALGTASLGSLLGITNINESWSDYISGLAVGGPFGAQTTLGAETLGDLLADLLPHGSALVPADDTTLADFVTALDPTFFTQTIDALLGLT